MTKKQRIMNIDLASKELSKELQMVYDFCEHHKNNLDVAADKTDDFTAQMMFTQQSTCYWVVQKFIEENFM